MRSFLFLEGVNITTASFSVEFPGKLVPPRPRLEPAALGLFLFIAIEIMFFAGLISAFLVFRMSPVVWPPAGQPRLPVEVTAFNTFILLASGFTFQWGFRALRRGNTAVFQRLLGVTAFLGSIFLTIQGVEWIRLLRFGLSVHSNVYGGFFYGLVGLHGLHVLGGLSVLLWVGFRAFKGVYNPENLLEVSLCKTYWFFAVGLWPILFSLIYL